MKVNRFWSWIFRGMGLFLLAYAVRALAVAAGSQHVPPQMYFAVASGVFFGSCLLSGGFHLKRLCALTGTLAVLSLLGLDLARWWAGQKSLADVLVTWGVIAGVWVIAI